MFQSRILVSALHVLTPVHHCLLVTVTNVSVLWATNWKMETITTVITLTSVKRRVMTVIKNVQILTDLINAGVDQGTEKSIMVTVRTLMSVPTAIMTVNSYVRTPSALLIVLVTILTELIQTESTAWISMSVFQTMITRVISHTWFVLMTLVDSAAHVKKTMKEQMTHVRVSNGFSA